MKEIFRQRMKERRVELGLRQKDIAAALKVVESCYANWEQGRTEPGLDNIHRLCKILKTSSDYLLGLERDDGTKEYDEF